MRQPGRAVGDVPALTDAPATIRSVAGWVAAANRITVLTGAGISTDSGIPDFRGPAGVWTTNPGAERLSTLEHYLADPRVRRAAWRRRLEHPAWTATPNAGHLALLDLQRRGALRAIVTQNIDGLHQAAGSDPALVIEIHGNLHQVACLSCGDRTAMADALGRVRQGEEDLTCRSCGGLLKSATISFGQALVPEVLAAARTAAADCDLFLAVGSSLTVQPAAGLVEVAARKGARVVIVNAQPTPYDRLAAAVLRASISAALPELCRNIAKAE